MIDSIRIVICHPNIEYRNRLSLMILQSVNSKSAIVVAIDNIEGVKNYRGHIDFCFVDCALLKFGLDFGTGVRVIPIFVSRAQTLNGGAEAFGGELLVEADDRAHLNVLKAIFGDLDASSPRLDASQDALMKANGNSPGADEAESDLARLLTPRQRQVLACLQNGDQNIAIAHKLGISENTVRLHVSAILRALKVSNRTAAVAAAERLGRPRPDRRAGPSYA